LSLAEGIQNGRHLVSFRSTIPLPESLQNWSDEILPISAGMLPVQGSWEPALQPNHLSSYSWAQK